MTYGEKVQRCRNWNQKRQCRATAWQEGLCRVHHGQRGNRIGRNAEQRVVDLVATLDPRPEWLISVRLATPHEDQAGIDVVVVTDMNPLWLQVKADRVRIPMRRELRAGVVDTIRVADRPDDELRDAIMKRLEAQYAAACILVVAEFAAPQTPGQSPDVE